MHITSQWQDASAGFQFVIVMAADHPQHIGGERGIEARMRQAVALPSTSDQGASLFVNAHPQQITLADTSHRLWLKSLVTQFDAVVRLSTIDTMPPESPVTGYQTYRFHMLDDEVQLFSFVPFDPENLTRVRLYPTVTPLHSWFADMLVDGSTILVELIPVQNVTMQPVETIGVSDPDGTLNLGQNETGFAMRNRLGGEIWGVVEFGT